MARTGKRTSVGIDERASNARLAALPGRSELTATPETSAKNDTVVSPPLSARPITASTKGTMTALARLLGQMAARDMTDTAAATEVTFKNLGDRDQGEDT